MTLFSDLQMRPLSENARIPRRWRKRIVSMTVPRLAVALLLIANLASGALSGPAWRHSHTISEHSPAHGQADGHSHGHRHGHSHDHAHRHNAVETLGEPAIEHLHVMWFGIPLTLPTSRDDSSNRPCTTGEWVPLLSEMLPLQVMVASDVLGLDLFDVINLAVEIESPPRAEPFVPPRISLLCDTARRERSGVLNI